MSREADQFDVPALKLALDRIASQMERVASELNELDGKLGDGDLGVTMVRGFRQVKEIEAELPEDLGLALMRCAQAFTKVSGSSFGTLMATGILAAAKATKGRPSAPWTEVSALLAQALEQMKLRGRAELGQKTVLDAIEAARIGALGHSDRRLLLAGVRESLGDALDRFRSHRAEVGRARIFADRSIGLDDPGMLAFKHMVDALAD